jgi:hypothetical protein
MRIGSSIGMIAVGLILALAVRIEVAGIDLRLVGWILAVVGLLGLVASIALARQRRPVVTPRHDVHQVYPPDERL